MLVTLLSMGILISIGIAFSRLSRAWIEPKNIRLVLTTSVYYILLPALILQATWTSSVPSEFLSVMLIAAICVLIPFALALLYGKWRKIETRTLGVIVLAASFPNTTYMGIPVLGQIFGDWTRNLIIAYDQFSCTPLILTLGISVASRMGNHRQVEHPAKALIKVPALWAACLGLALYRLQFPIPSLIDWFLGGLASAVSPCMLIALGLALEWQKFDKYSFEIANLLAVLQLALVPLCAYILARQLEFDALLLQAVTLEAAMPSMVFGLVLCDRFGLDSHYYARLVSYTTGLSLFSLPLVYQLLQ